MQRARELRTETLFVVPRPSLRARCIHHSSVGSVLGGGVGHGVFGMGPRGLQAIGRVQAALPWGLVGQRAWALQQVGCGRGPGGSRHNVHAACPARGWRGKVAGPKCEAVRVGTSNVEKTRSGRRALLLSETPVCTDSRGAAGTSPPGRLDSGSPLARVGCAGNYCCTAH